MKRIALATILVAAGLAAAVIVYRAWAPLGKLQDGALPQMVEMEALAKGRMAQFEVSDTPTALPPLTMEAPDGRTIGMDHFGGKVVLLNFWATWCAPCLREMPSLDRLQKELGGETFTVVALSQDRGGRDVAGRFLEKLGLRDLAPLCRPHRRGGGGTWRHGAADNGADRRTWPRDRPSDWRCRMGLAGSQGPDPRRDR